jgi:dTDP-4-amino-4,6-dideoxygalactose transaminase
VSTIGAAGAFSFYPTKNLGALGDGGAIVTNDGALAERIKRLRNGGQARTYDHQEPGVNSRLDEMQAAVLRARLTFLAGWTAKRRALAACYRSALATAPLTLLPERDAGHVYHLFVVQSRRRDDLQRHLRERGIDTLVHYPKLIPQQPAFAGNQPADCPRAAAACDEILSLPIHPALADADLHRVADAIRDFQEAN